MDKIDFETKSDRELLILAVQLLNGVEDRVCKIEKWRDGNGTPGSTLHVVGDQTVSGAVTVESSVTVNGPLGALTIQGDSGAAIIKTIANNAGSANYFKLTNTSGNLYIGQDSSAGNALNSVALPYAGTMLTESAYPLAFGTNNVTRMVITEAGNVGIGTTAPGAKLEVNGNIVSSGTINAQNGLCINNVCKSVWGAGTGDAVLAATQTFTGTNSFTSLSTHTFSGTIDIGYQIVQQSCSGPASCTATCPTGKIVLGGGCSADGSTVPQNNRPLGNNAWYCASVASNWNAYAICARIKP